MSARRPFILPGWDKKKSTFILTEHAFDEWNKKLDEWNKKSEHHRHFLIVGHLPHLPIKQTATAKAIALINSLFSLFALIVAIFFRIGRRSTCKARARLETPPVTTLDIVVRFLWAPKTYDRVFKPARADLVDAWEQAHIAGETRRAWYIKHVLSRWIMLSHMASQIPSSIIKLLLKFFEVSK